MTGEPPTEAARIVPEHLIVGQIVAPFGVRGELKVNIHTEFPERLFKLEQVVLAPFSSIPPGLAPTAALDPRTARVSPARPAPAPGSVPIPPSGPTTYSVVSTHLHKGQLLLRLEGVDTVEAAESLRGYWVMVPIEKARKLPRGSYYLYQVAGLDVYTTARRYLGKVDEVLTGAANDVYVVRGPGVLDPSGELLVPAVRAVVKRIELKRGRIVIVPPEEWA